MPLITVMKKYLQYYCYKVDHRSRRGTYNKYIPCPASLEPGPQSYRYGCTPRGTETSWLYCPIWQGVSATE